MNNVDKPAKTLKDLRMRAGLTQYALSELLGLRGKTVGEWERGICEPHIPVSKVLLLCQTLDCSLEELSQAVEAARKNRELSANTPSDKELVAA